MAMMIAKFHKIVQSKKVWTAFAILISIAFVSVYSGARSGQQKQRMQKQSEIAGQLFGKDVTRQEFGQAYRNVYVMYTMMVGRPINITERIDSLLHQAAWQRLATLKKAQQMGLTATRDQIIAMIESQPLFANQQTGRFDRNAYNAFVSQLLPRMGLSAAGFESMIAENVIIEKASRMASQSALVTDAEIKKAFHLFNDQLTVQYATIPLTLVTEPTVTDEDAENYFKENPSEFLMPEKVKVRYVQYAVSDYTNGVAVTDGMVTNFYENYKNRFVKTTAEDAAEDAEPQYKPLEEVRDTIVMDITQALARKKAVNAADGLVSELSDESMTFDQVAEQAGVAIDDNLPSFAMSSELKGIDPTAPFVQTAFTLELDSTHYYSDPVVGRDYVYIIALEKKYPSFLPTFDVVKDDAIQAASAAAMQKTYDKKAESIHADIEAALKAGSSFTDAASKFNLQVKTTEPFDVSDPPEGEYGHQLMEATALFDAGTLVDLISTDETYMIAYVAVKTVADETTQLPSMRARLEAGIRHDKAGRLVNAWQESTLKEAGMVDYLAQTNNDES